MRPKEWAQFVTVPTSMPTTESHSTPTGKCHFKASKVQSTKANPHRFMHLGAGKLMEIVQFVRVFWVPECRPALHPLLHTPMRSSFNDQNPPNDLCRLFSLVALCRTMLHYPALLPCTCPCQPRRIKTVKQCCCSRTTAHMVAPFLKSTS